MEICLECLKHFLSPQFKIDLIVWKLDCKKPKIKDRVRFKIDLIVWKSDVTNKRNTIDDMFKIDLIVWKW